MTRDETLQVLAILKAAYPSSYNGMTKREANGTVMVWCTQFADVPVDIVLMAVHKLISTNKFPPAISEVKDKLGNIHFEAYEMISRHPMLEKLTDNERRQYQRIYEITSAYKMSKMSEPSLDQMLTSRQMLQLGAGTD